MPLDNTYYASVQLFDMLSYVQLEGDPRGVPPAQPPPGWRERYSARQKIAGAMVTYARSAGQVGRNLVLHLCTLFTSHNEVCGKTLSMCCLH